METVDIAKGRPAADAARASAMSPSRQERPLSPVGPTTAGSAEGAPSRRVEQVAFRNIHQRVRAELQASKAVAIVRESALVLRAAVDIGKDETRQATPRDCAQILDVDGFAETHGAAYAFCPCHPAGEYTPAEERTLQPALAVHAAAAEAGRLAGGIEPVDRVAIRRRSTRPARSIWMPPRPCPAHGGWRIAMSGPARRSTIASASAGAKAIGGPALEPGDAAQLLVVVEALAGRIAAS